MMIFGSLSLPNRGDLKANLNTKTSPAGTPNAGVHYIQHAHHDAHTPNMVTVTLADYRGYDTLGETTVIFTASLICFLLLRKKRGWNDRKK
jgi:multicomponent Na+:H+ antiporter subunit B